MRFLSFLPIAMEEWKVGRLRDGRSRFGRWRRRFALLCFALLYLALLCIAFWKKNSRIVFVSLVRSISWKLSHTVQLLSLWITCKDTIGEVHGNIEASSYCKMFNSDGINLLPRESSLNVLHGIDK
jgi:predicted MFS family arabinose efflux permease